MAKCWMCVCLCVCVCIYIFLKSKDKMLACSIYREWQLEPLEICIDIDIYISCIFLNYSSAHGHRLLLYLIIVNNDLNWPISKENIQMVTVEWLSCVWLWDPMNCTMPGFPVLHYHPQLLKLMSIESVMPSNHLTPCCSLLLLSSMFPSIRVFSSELALHIR